MQKTYEPLNMVMNGRYAVLYGKLAPDLQFEVLARMKKLIEEERDYEDKGNYGHFCNILPTIAIDEVLQRNGKTPDEAFGMIFSPNALWRACISMISGTLTPEQSDIYEGVPPPTVSRSQPLLSFILRSILFSVSKKRFVAMGAPKKRTPRVFQPNMCHQEV